MQRPSVAVGEYHVHKLRHKPIKSSGPGQGVGVVESGENVPAGCTLPSQSSLATADSDSDMQAASKPPQHQQAEPAQHPKGSEVIVGKMSTDSDPLSDDYTLPGSPGKKAVAINTVQVEHFTHRLLPVQSPEFDNVMDQVTSC